MKIGNLSTVEAWTVSGGSCPPGDWIARIVDVDDKPSRAGNEMLTIEWQVDEGDWRGAEIREWLVITADTLGKVKSFLEAIGYPIPDGEFEIPTNKLVGYRAQIIVRADSYVKDGETVETTKVMGHKPVPKGSDVPSDASGFAQPSTSGNDGGLPFLREPERDYTEIKAHDNR